MSGIIGYDRGAHLRGTPLWFDPDRAKALAVLTAVPSRPPPAHQRAVVPEALAERLARLNRFASMLPTPLGRWVGVGGQKLEFWPTGAPLSVAALLVTQGTRVLISASPRVGSVQWPRASHLVLPAPSPGFRGGTLDRVVQGLALFLDSAASEGRDARVQVDDVEAALTLSEELAALGYEHRRVGWLGKLAPRPGPRRVVIAADGQPGPRSRLASVQTRRSSGPRPADATFRLDWTGSMAAVGRLVREIGATTVTLISSVPVHPPPGWPSRARLEVVGGSRQLVFRDHQGLHGAATN